MISYLKDKIKRKLMKKSTHRGITFSDKALFEVGAEFKYVITNNRIFIVKNENFDEITKKLGIENVQNYKGKISKKGANQIPLIDIRRKEALQSFGKAETLVVDIFQDYIIVTGFEEEPTTDVQTSGNNVSAAIQKTSDNILSKYQKVSSLSEKKLRKKFSARLPISELKACVGEQNTYDLNAILDESSFKNVATVPSYIRDAVSSLEIPLMAASFFSGAGIFDVPFIDSGFEVVFALEKDEAAAQTYLQNNGDHILCGDIRTFDTSLVKNIPVFFGGPPCQGFSNSNRHTNFLENENNLMVREYIRVIKSNPELKVFILENVPQILTAGDGQFRDEILAELGDFEISYGIMNAADFGSPQARKRAIFIGSKIGKIEIPQPLIAPVNYSTVKEALANIPDDAPNQKDYSKPRKETLERMKYIKQGQNWESIPEHLRTTRMSHGTHSSIYRRLDENKPSITITNPRKSNILHPHLNRILSVRECARLFGLRDSFRFYGNLDQKQQQIANAIPIHLGAAIANTVKNAIQQFNIRMGFTKPVLI